MLQSTLATQELIMVKIDTLVSKMKAVGFMYAQADIERILSLASDNDLSHIELLANALDDEISQRNAARIEKNKKQSNINHILTHKFSYCFYLLRIAQTWQPYHAFFADRSTWFSLQDQHLIFCLKNHPVTLS